MGSVVSAAFSRHSRRCASSRRRALGPLFALLALACWCAPDAAAQSVSADLQVAQYTATPNPIGRGATATFSVRAVNNGPDAADGSIVTIAVSPNFELVPGSVPSFCSATGVFPAAQTLVCVLTPFAAGANLTFAYQAIARVQGTQNTSATIAGPNPAPPQGFSDPNPGNNQLTIGPSVQAGVDLSVTKTADRPSYPGGDTVIYTLQPRIAGPDSTTGIRVTDNLPPSSDLDSITASGTNWSCVTGATVVCNYTGGLPVIPPGGTLNLPAIEIRGRVARAISGTITNSAFTSVTAAGVLENNAANDSSGNVVVNVTPGADLAAQKSMAPNPVATGQPVTLTLRIVNNGPATVTGATISDSVPAGFVIGTLPGGCVASGQLVTCTSASISGSGASQSFIIPLTAPAAATTGVNTATVTPPSGITDPIVGNNTADFAYTVQAPFADLFASKTKTAGPVGPGATLTSTISIGNAATSLAAASYSPANPLVFYDDLGPNEQYVAVVTPGWSCVTAPMGPGTRVTCTSTGSGTIAIGGSLSVQLQTQPIGLPTSPPFPTLANEACVGSTAGSQATPPDPAGNTPSEAADCATAGVVATTRVADLAVTKEISTDQTAWGSSLSVPTTDTQYFYRFIVRNNNAAGGDTAPTVVLNDTLPNFLSDGPFLTPFTVVSAGGGSCSILGPNLQCTWQDLPATESRTVIVSVSRPVESGTFVNTARVSSPDAVDANPANNQAQATVTVDPIADVTIPADGKNVNPNPAVVGQTATYTISFRNLGPNPAAAVQVADPIDTTRFEIVAGSVSTTSGGSCFIAGGNTPTCNIGTMARGANFQMSFQVRPRFPFAGAPPGSFPVSVTNTATISTTTVESDAANNADSITHDVNAPNLDLLVEKTEPADGDPLAFGDALVYLVRVLNVGPSRATDVRVIDTPAAPPGYTIAPSAFAIESQSAPGRTPTCTLNSPAAGQIRCVADAVAASNYLDAGEQIVFRLTFTSAGPPPPSSLTFSNTARVAAAESPEPPGAPDFDRDPANNEEAETTTILPRTDLEVVSKTTITASPVNINQPVTYEVVLRNNGPSQTERMRFVDVLPPGFLRTATPVTGVAGGGATLGATNCSGTATVTCNLVGTFPPTGTVTLNIEAIPAYPYTGAVGTAVTNTANIEPGRGGADFTGPPVSRDTVPGNNQRTSTVTVQRSSLSGRVYADNNRSNSFDAGEAISGVTLTLTGTDLFGNPLPAGVTATTAADGTFTFNNLPPSGPAGYTIVQTQPAGFFDSTEFAGSVGAGVGATPPNTAIAASVCPPPSNCGAGAAQNTISGIVLAPNTQATGYNFQELASAQVAGFVYVDANNDGQRGSGEAGINGGVSPVTIRISGTDYAGNAVSITQSIGSNGGYSFIGLPPSDATGYLITQVNEPPPGGGASYVDGRDQNGAGAGNVIPGSAGRPVGETIGPVVVNPGASLTERNFGELIGGALAGVVFVDANANAVREGGEVGVVPGVTITLSGTNDIGQAVSCATITQADGTYAFPVAGAADPICQTLRPSGPGGYTVTMTPPAGLTVTGASSGSLGGSGQPPNTPLVGASTVTGIQVGSGNSGSGYNFGVQGQLLSGSVYVDTNGNGQRDPGETGIPGVTVTLSGTTAGGTNVCTAIAPNPCTAVTDASGNYRFPQLPASDGAGYTLTEQPQSAPPLNRFADGAESVGTVNGAPSGTAGNDAISGIVLGSGQIGANYNFGERPGALSGSTYIDANGNGQRDPGEGGLADVTITLSGTTVDGVNVCTLLPTCAFTTGADGAYLIPNLPAGTYTLTQTQPANFADGAERPGNLGGTAGAPGTSVISNIVVPPGGVGTNYDFGELAAGLSGRVCIDIANDGCSAGDPPLSGVTLTLTGVAADGSPVTRTVQTAADGSYAFLLLPTPNAQGYTITQTQPATYSSGLQNTTVGSAGGSAANNVVANIPLPGGSAATGYDFGELQADLQLTKTVAPQRLNIGQSVTFTLTLTNAGPTQATGVAVRDSLPAGFSFVSANPSLGSFNSATGIWTIGTINNAQTATLTLVAATNPTGPYRNVAEVSASNVPDPNSTPGNGVAGENDQASAEVVALAVVTGSVFEDRNGNGIRDPGEPPFANRPVVITDSTGAQQTVLTDQNGNFRADVAPGQTTLDVQAPPGVRLTTGNDPQTVNVAASSTPTASPPVGYQSLGGLAGSVWLDSGSSVRQRDGGDAALAGWIVELVDPATGAVVRTTTTDGNGAYALTDVPAGTYQLRFRDPQTRVVYGTPVNGEQGNPQAGSRPAPGNERGALEVTIVAGQTLSQQSLPVDPSGVVYDAVSRDLIPGATVTLRPVGACAGWNPATHIVNSTLGGYSISGTSISMTTGANGLYVFLFTASAPAACVFELAVIPPGQYRFPSTLIPPAAPFDVPAGLGTVFVQPQAVAPPVGASTTYYLQFTIGSARNNLLHNHIPLDPASGSVVAIEKSADVSEGEVGDSVRYTLRVRNVRGPRLPLVLVDDRLPLGFRYIPGTARVRLPGAGQFTVLADPAGGVGPNLTFRLGAGLQPGQEATITYRVRLGIGADNGDGVNRATAISGAVRSNTAQARVRVRGGVFTSEACVAGKIWVDCNENQIQDPEEVGVPGVRLYFEDGTYLISDSEGKYSYCGLKPITHVLKVDRSTLPKGAYLGTTGSRNVGDPDSLFVDLRNGELHRADFRIASCTVDVVNQVYGRRPVGEVAAPEVEKGDPTRPAVTLDPQRDTRCQAPRHETDPAYREAEGECRPAPEPRARPISPREGGRP